MNRGGAFYVFQTGVVHSRIFTAPGASVRVDSGQQL